MSYVEDRIGNAVWGTVHSSDTKNYGYIQRLILREARKATGNQSGLLKAIEQVSGGGSVDLKAIETAAERGASRGVNQEELAEAVVAALAESLPEQEADQIAAAVVDRMGERLGGSDDPR